MLKYIFCFFFLTVAAAAEAQSATDTVLMVPGTSGPYFYHVVEAKETIYSLSRRFGLEPRQLAEFNGLTLKSSLNMYQLLKIPLTASDLDQASATPPAGAVPLYHKVTRGETLFHISQLQGGVPVARVKEWNKLKGNEVHPGDFLIVGWLTEGGSPRQASGAAAAGQAPAAEKPGSASAEAAPQAPPSAPVPAAAQAPRPQPASASPETAASDGFLGEVIASENASRRHSVPRQRSGAMEASGDAFSVSPPPVKAAAAPAVVKPAVVSPVPAQPQKEGPTPAQPVAAEAPPDATAFAQPAPPPAPEPVAEAPGTDSFAVMLNRVTGGASTPQSTPRAAAGSTPDEGASQPVAVAAAATPATVKSAFKAQFDEQTADGAKVAVSKGAAGWFKSNVKPGSGRYYALCNDLPRGTIVRVVNPLNQQSVLVKVLDVIPKQKDNYNLIIKLSDAARGDLGVTQSRFWCEINYPAPEK